MSFPHWVRTEGLSRLARAWLRILACAGVGAALARYVPLSLPDVATSAVAPFGSLLIGMSFAWSVTIASLLQTRPGRTFGAQRNGLHYRTFVMKFLFSVSIIFVTTVLWAIVGARAFNVPSAHVGAGVRLAGRAAMFALTGFMLTEMWDTIADVARMLLTVEWIRRLVEPLSPLEEERQESAEEPAPAAVVQASALSELEPTRVRAAPEPPAPGHLRTEPREPPAPASKGHRR